MGSVLENLAREGFELPEMVPPVANYVPATRAGALVFTSGQLPMLEGALIARGTVDSDVSMKVAKECARRCALNALAAAATVCDLDEVARVVKVVGYVASRQGFFAQPEIMNGASDLLVLAFGERGGHAREAVGVPVLPMNAPVEVSLVLELGVSALSSAT